ncbi:MAG: hypothetical protein A2X12_11970 [Bacteroidetes bacterium GWE2_29_8]|nr:MAG: hypothetical protein A2X12_11970 [Bacteroidetes bacterium GWE2_29_8]
MKDVKEIQIFVSCPSDVNDNKDRVKEICKNISDTTLNNPIQVNFKIREGNEIVAPIGKRPQQVINDLINDYDIYFGIWWMKFGSKTGEINPITNKEFESGTHEEFFEALKMYKEFQKPKIYLFFKTPSAINDVASAEQLLNVLKFRDEQMTKGWVNSFDTDNVFNDKVYKILMEILTKMNTDQNESDLNKSNFQHDINWETPKDFIPRTIKEISEVKEQINFKHFKLDTGKTLQDIILNKNRIVLLGGAGSGKSFELKNLFNHYKQENSPLIPIFKSFNTYTPDITIEKFLPNNWDKMSNLLIILDGLDEILSEHFNTVIKQIINFSENHKEIKIVISCRTNFYELPINNSSGTLSGFEIYTLNNFNTNDIKSYFGKMNSNAKFEVFEKEVFDKKMNDIVFNPFFLMLLVENFLDKSGKMSNRYELLENFIKKRISFDQEHYKTSIDIRTQHNDIIKLLEKVALSMEILSKNYIKETELLEIISSDAFCLIKHCTAFKKKDGEDYIWQFEHNNIQEYLAAKALSTLNFEQVKSFITFENTNKLIPNWINTLAFLIGILPDDSELLKKLIDWLLENEKEILIKVEPDKIDKNVRDKIFKEIFNYYKQYDIWISSNKFDNNELAKFGQSSNNLTFLINEIKSETTTVVKINAIRLIGYFELKLCDKRKIKDLFLQNIKNNLDDVNFVNSTIYALKRANIHDESTLKELMTLVGDRKNQYIRSAMYAMLLKSDYLEDYIDYLISGYELIEKKSFEDRENVTLLDERWNIEKCFENIKSPNGLKRIFEYLNTNAYFGYNSVNNVFASIIENTKEAYKKDNTIYECIKEIFLYHLDNHKFQFLDLELSFFDSTNNRETVFKEIWNDANLSDQNKKYAIAKLINKDLVNFVFEQYDKRNINESQLEQLYYKMNFTNNDYYENYRTLLKEKMNIDIYMPPKIDYEAKRIKGINDSFDLLFHKDALLNKTIEVFGSKDILYIDDIIDIQKKDTESIDIIIQLLNDLLGNNQEITKEQIEKWFQNEEAITWDIVWYIYMYLSNYKHIKVNQVQKEWIGKWCNDNVSKIDFRTAIEVSENERISINTMALCIWYFCRKFEIDLPQNIMLDMLSFDNSENSSWVGIDYLTSKLEKKEIVKRMIENLKIGIQDDNVLLNHIKYLSENKIEEAYEIILKEIVNFNKIKYYKRREYLDIYISNTKDVEGLKKIIDEADFELVIAIIDKLIANKEESFVKNWLHKYRSREINENEKIIITEKLISLQDIESLSFYKELIQNKINNNAFNGFSVELNKLKNKEAIPYLINLLEMYYNSSITNEKFDENNLNNIIGGFYNIAFVSQNNFNYVKKSLKCFVDKNIKIQKNVKSLLYTIERMEEQYYSNHSKSFNVNDVKEKLKYLSY